jgi:hypothetical protein
MKVVTLNPTLEACIETQAKRLFNQTASQLLKSPENPTLQEQLETLRLFLEQVDFRKLRAESEPLLLEGKKVVFKVWREGYQVNWKMHT